MTRKPRMCLDLSNVIYLPDGSDALAGQRAVEQAAQPKYRNWLAWRIVLGRLNIEDVLDMPLRQNGNWDIEDFREFRRNPHASNLLRIGNRAAAAIGLIVAFPRTSVTVAKSIIERLKSVERTCRDHGERLAAFVAMAGSAWPTRLAWPPPVGVRPTSVRFPQW